jgi:hypothetical protein
MSTKDVVVKLSEASRALNRRAGDGGTKARGQLLSLAFVFLDLAKRIRSGALVVSGEQEPMLLGEIDDVLAACADAGVTDAEVVVEANEVVEILSPTVMFATLMRHPMMGAMPNLPHLPNGLSPIPPDFDPPIPWPGPWPRPWPRPRPRPPWPWPFPQPGPSPWPMPWDWMG